MRNETEVEAEIVEKGLDAPRLSPEHIDDLVGLSTCEFQVFHGVQTVCSMRLPNGFTVVGTSACASPENFDAELGERIAKGNARNAIWELEGYLLRQKLSETYW